MSRTPLSALLRPADPRHDGELLARFADAGDEAAFAELVRRYGGLVWAVCRRLTPDRHAAEDAFQATFLVLVRRAGAVRRGSAAGFLHGVARRVSARCRRRATEPLPEVATVDADPSLGAVRREEAEMLHAELARLPAGCREVVLLCDLGGLSRAEAAGRLGWSEGSVKGRLERGRKLLAARLAKRGIAGGLVAVSAAPAELTAAVCRSAVAVWLGGPLPVGLAGLVRDGLPWGVGKLVAGLVTAGLVMGLAAVARPTALPPAAPPDPRAILREAESVLERSDARPVRRGEAYFVLADGYRLLGDAGAARNRLAKATASYLQWNPDGRSATTMAVRLHARLGDADAVLKLLAAMPPDRTTDRAEVTRTGVEYAARAGHPAAADAVARAAKPEDRDGLLQLSRIWAAVRAAERGDRADALRTVEGIPDARLRFRALVGEPLSTEFSDIGWGDPREWEHRCVALALARAGNRAGGVETVSRAVADAIASADDDTRFGVRLYTLSSAVGATARLGEVERCREWHRQLTQATPDGESFLLGLAASQLAAAEAAAGNDAVALRLADTAAPERRALVLAEVGLAQWRAGRKETGLATLKTAFAAHNGLKGGGQSQSLGMAFGLVGDLEAANRLWGEQTTGWFRLGERLLLRGQVDATRAVLNSRHARRDRPVIAGRLVHHLARNGRTAEARQVVTDAPTDAQRAVLLARLAHGLLGGDPD